jgi:hypothetical protein
MSKERVMSREFVEGNTLEGFYIPDITKPCRYFSEVKFQ